jgi:predicted transcriptional regulator
LLGSEPVTRALEAMSKHGISGVPVVDEGGRFLGVFCDAGEEGQDEKGKGGKAGMQGHR